MGSVLDSLPSDALSHFQLPQYAYAGIIAGNPIQVAPPDPNRTFISFSLANGGPATLFPQQPLVLGGTTFGLNLPALGNIILSYWVHGPIVCYPWFAFGNGTGELAVIVHSLLSSAEQAYGSMPLKLPPVLTAPAPAPVGGRLAQLWHTLTGR